MNQTVSRQVEEFLHDIAVELGDEYADPSRDMFPMLMPYYALTRADHPTDRIVVAYQKLKLAGAIEQGNFRSIVAEALHRCTCMDLGRHRTLMVMDLAKEVCPEVFNLQLWFQLFLRASVEMQAVWLAALGQRLQRWKVVLSSFPKDSWLHVVSLLDPVGLVIWTRWATTHCGFRGLEMGEKSSWLDQVAMNRIDTFSKEATYSEVDFDEVRSQINQITGEPMPSNDSKYDAWHRKQWGLTGASDFGNEPSPYGEEREREMDDFVDSNC